MSSEVTKDPLVDDPKLDFRQRWRLPEHFLWDDLDFQKIDLEGYVKAAIDLLPTPPCEVLDVGCGDGWVANQLDRKGYKVVGVDFSARAVQFARVVVPSGTFEVVDGREIGEKKEWHGRFPVAIHIEVLEHIPLQYHSRVLTGIRRCLQPGGILVLTLPSTNIPVGDWHYKHFTLEEGAALLSESGYEVKTVVNQCLVTPLFSRPVTRLLRNHYYDLRFVRRALRRLFLTKLNITGNPARAGRYIFVARNPG